MKASLCLILALLGLCQLSHGEEPPPVTTAAIKQALIENKLDEARVLATRMIAEQPNEYTPLWIRAKIAIDLEQFALAIPDLEAGEKLLPAPSAVSINYLGTIRYQAGQIKEALADFDRAIKLDPQLESGHWQRGIVYYDLRQWENGRKQFEQYQGVDDNDVENVVWRAMCMARDPKIGWAKAAGDLWQVKHDRRVPLMVVHQLFADKATEADVLKAVDEGNPGEAELLSRRFYAHLYLGLYHEVRSNKPEALKHLELASGKYKLPGYMAEVARVHVGLLKEKK
jgi:lipoprotein NlpI